MIPADNDQPAAEPLAADPLAGIKALLEERNACEERVKQINIELQKARGLIDGRTLGVPRKPRVASVNGQAGDVTFTDVTLTTADDEAPEPPVAA